MSLEAAMNVSALIQSAAVVTCEHFLVCPLVSFWGDKEFFQLCEHKARCSRNVKRIEVSPFGI